MNDIIDSSAPASGLDAERDASLRSIGHISYALHAIVAVGAVIPGVQASVLLLLPRVNRFVMPLSAATSAVPASRT